MSAPDRLARGLSEAGFVEVECHPVSRTYRIPSGALAHHVRSYLAVHHQALLRYCSPQLVDLVVERAASGIERSSRDGESELSELELLYVASKPRRSSNADVSRRCGVALQEEHGG